MPEAAYTLTPIAHIRSEFREKFGIPRQSGLVDALRAQVVFTPPFRNADALRGLEDYSHLWLIWQFSQVVAAGADGANWSPTVRPPRLGGNVRMGVFATRSPYRPNALGLSCVRLVGVQPDGPEGPVLTVAGADLLDGTPIYDIKPYLPGVDAHPEAAAGFAGPAAAHALTVRDPGGCLAALPPRQRAALEGVLQNDPRPGYQCDPARVYGLAFAGYTVRFTVDNDVLTVLELKAE